VQPASGGIPQRKEGPRPGPVVPGESSTITGSASSLIHRSITKVSHLASFVNRTPDAVHPSRGDGAKAGGGKQVARQQVVRVIAQGSQSLDSKPIIAHTV
jgi:hypothetical protein